MPVELGERHVGTAVAALLLLAASRLPVTRTGLGSATSALRLVSMGSTINLSAVRWGSLLLTGVLMSGLVLGVTVMVRGTIAARVWAAAAAVVGLVGLALVALLRTNSGPSVVAVLLAGAVLATAAALERRRLRRA